MTKENNAKELIDWFLYEIANKIYVSYYYYYYFFVVHFCDILISLYKVVTYNYVSVLAYSMTKSVVIALILFFVFYGILLYWV